MWYDATSAAGSFEASDSPVKGKLAYARAPVKLTKSSGWLYTVVGDRKEERQAGRRVEVHLGVLQGARGTGGCR
jgi:hypothetical protein